MSNGTTESVLATIGTVLWCIQLIPQIIVNYRRKDTEGFPESMCFLWAMCAPFFGIFMVSQNANMALMIQPHLFGFFCFIVYVQVMYYPPVSRTKKDLILRAGGYLIFAVAVEVGFIIPLRKLHKKGVVWPTTVFGVIASVVLALGLIPPYFELAKRKGRVIGINFLFLFMDFSGAVFSLASLLIDLKHLDIMSCVLYSICAALELGIFVSHGVWWLRFRLLKDRSEWDDDEDADIEQQVDETDITSIVSNEAAQEKHVGIQMTPV